MSGPATSIERTKAETGKMEWHVVDRDWRSLGFLFLDLAEHSRKSGTHVQVALPADFPARVERAPSATEEIAAMTCVTLKWDTMSTHRPNSDAIWTMPVLQAATDNDANLIYRLRPEEFQTMAERFGKPRPVVGPVSEGERW